ncbi:NADH-quinone oxidoreductase subunit J [Orbaceae bacterium ESL0721]|nr:NADH-quinone oxidoreductase subunit J [Orbaceae bacterium ESL0721]
MAVIFYIATIIAIFASIKVISCRRVDKAILYFVLLLLAIAFIFIIINAYFSVILSIILFMGGISILFLYVSTFLNINQDIVENGKRGISPKIWLGPLILTFILLVILIYGVVSTTYARGVNPHNSLNVMSPHAYIIMIELSAYLLLGAFMIAYHFMRRLFKGATV